MKTPLIFLTAVLSLAAMILKLAPVIYLTVSTLLVISLTEFCNALTKLVKVIKN
jgi:hypothetical protein